MSWYCIALLPVTHPGGVGGRGPSETSHPFRPCTLSVQRPPLKPAVQRGCPMRLLRPWLRKRSAMRAPNDQRAPFLCLPYTVRIALHLGRCSCRAHRPAVQPCCCCCCCSVDAALEQLSALARLRCRLRPPSSQCRQSQVEATGCLSCLQYAHAVHASTSSVQVFGVQSVRN